MGNLETLGFDARKTEPATDRQFAPIPQGDYLVAITRSEMKLTNSGSGKYLKLTFTVLDGPHKGRLFWDNLNIVNTNSKTEEIARGQLSAICRAVDVPTPSDSAELHDRPFMARVAIEHDQNGKPQNRPKHFFPREGAVLSAMFVPAIDVEKAPPPPAAKPKKTSGPPVPNDDDIPF